MPEEQTHLDLFSGIRPEDSQLQLSGLDSEPSPCASPIPDAEPFLDEYSQESPVTTTSGTFTDQAGAVLPFSLVDRHVSLAVEPGSDEARTMTAGSGTKLCECLRKQSRMASFSRRLLESRTWTSTEYFLKWSGSGTRFRHSIFRLVPWIPLRSDDAIGLLDSWPTPRARDIKDTSDGEWAMNRQDGKTRTDQLPHMLKSVGKPASGCLARMDTYAERLMTLSAWLMGYQIKYLLHWDKRIDRSSRRSEIP